MKSKVWVKDSLGVDQHLAKLEKELEKEERDNPTLRNHIRRLKMAWRRGRFYHQAA